MPAISNEKLDKYRKMEELRFEIAHLANELEELSFAAMSLDTAAAVDLQQKAEELRTLRQRLEVPNV